MDKNTLSVCMITKNEEQNIERCLKSIIHIADEIIVVDTGSDDKTVELAKIYGAKVILHPWKNDFSDARNKSIEHATKKWILFLDADEELPYESGLYLKEVISKPNNKFEGYYLRLVNIISNVDVGDSIVFRVFRNRKEYKFKGKMHEQIINSIQDRGGHESVASTEIKILHYGYDPSLADIAQKSRRNIELLLNYEEKEKDGYYYYALGNEYVRTSNMEEAFKCFDIAYKRALKAKAKPIYFTYLMVSILKSYCGMKRFDKVISSVKKFKNDCRDFRDLHFYECLANIESGKFSNAKKCLKLFMNTKNFNYSYPSSNFEGQHNLDDLMDQLNKGSINHSEKLLSTVILAKKQDNSLIDTIKSLNELSYEVIIVTPKASDLDREICMGLGAIIYDLDYENDEKYYSYAFKKTKGDYVILANPGELCSYEGQQVLVEFLEKAHKDAYYILMADKFNKVIDKKVRLFKNSKKLNNIESIEKFVSENRIGDSNVPLYVIN